MSRGQKLTGNLDYGLGNNLIGVPKAAESSDSSR